MQSPYTIRTQMTFLLVVGAMLLASQSGDASAQELTRGFDVRLKATPKGTEFRAQDDLWILQVTLKPMRMIWVDVTNGESGKKSRELYWYLVYRVVNRQLDRPAETRDSVPINEQDVRPKPIFIPEATLITNDNGRQEVYHDVISLEVQDAITSRERMALSNPVEIIQEVPAATAEGAEDEKAIDGVFIWRNVDAKTDYFTVFLSGFASSYRIAVDPDGNDLAWRRTIQQEFWRPGDRFDENQQEFRRRNEPKWIFRADGSSDRKVAPIELPKSRVNR